MNPRTDNKCIIIITGDSQDRRIAFLRRLHRHHQRLRKTAGFISKTESITPIDTTVPPELCFIGEIGAAAPAGKGFRTPLFSQCPAIVFGIDKHAIREVVDTIATTVPFIVDLDTTMEKVGLRMVHQHLSRMDADRIGAAAGLIGLMEAGLGSILHTYRFPLKGHVLSSLENLMLICSGKVLNGRGLVKIAFISAMLKAFSPMGCRIRPMIYIFLQGTAFALPIHLFGWHAMSVLIGSLLLGWLTLGISLTVDYLTFGISVFHAFEGAAAALFHWLGIPSPSLMGLIFIAFFARSTVSIAVAAFAYFGNPAPLMHWLIAKRITRTRAAFERCPRRCVPAIRAIYDMLSARFILGFFISILLMIFFADLTRAGLIQVVIRGLVISYLGFLLIRRLNPRAVGARLDRVFHMNLEESLHFALAVVNRDRQTSVDCSSSSNQNRSTQKSRLQPIEASHVISSLPTKQKG